MASMDYEFRDHEKIADIASQFNTTVNDIMKINNVLPPYPKYVNDLPQDVIRNGTIELPYVTSGRQTFESYYNTASEVLGINYVDANAMEETQTYNASSRYLSSSVFNDIELRPGRSHKDCYISTSHGDFKWFPCYPESISDSNQASYNPVSILGRSEPFQYYTGSGPRTVSVKFQMHTDMCPDVNYIYTIADLVEACCYPNYGSGISAVKVTLHVTSNINITGIISSVSTDYSGPIIDDKYAVVDLGFSVTEVTGNPPSYSDIKKKGGRR